MGENPEVAVPRVMPRLEPLPDGFPRPGDAIDPGFRHEVWRRLNDAQLGVDVIDPDGHIIGMAETNRTFLGFDTGGWRPVDGRKHVLVGELDRYSFYDPLGDEADFNLFIHPDEAFRNLISDVRAMMSRDERKEIHRRSRGEGFTMEAEITPDEEYYNNFYFPTKEGRRTQLEGGKIGVYGPWVRDLSHGGRPEIHPSEAIWFRTGNAESLAGPGRVRHVRWTLIVLQDDSNRFDRPSDYDINIFNAGDLANLKRPWSASPRRARFTVALLGLRGQAVNYNLRMQDGHRVFSWPGEDARSITATAQDLSTVTVTKVHSRRAEFKVRLGRLVPDPSDANVLHCFMSLDVQVGEGDRGKEGFAEMSLEAWAPGTGPGSGGDDDANSGGRPVRPRPSDRPRPGGRPHQPGDGPRRVEP